MAGINVEERMEKLEDILRKGKSALVQASTLLLDSGKKEDYISLITYLSITHKISFAAEIEAKNNAETIEFWQGVNQELAARIAEKKEDFDTALKIYEKADCPGEAMLTCMHAKEFYSKNNPEKAKHYEEKAVAYAEKYYSGQYN